jgi:cardiolipin synthase A/B
MDWQTIWDLVKEIWPHLVAVLTLTIDLTAAAHVVLRKRDNRSAIGWVGIIWLVPILGVILYVLLGINRVQRKAVILRRGPSRLGREWARTPEQMAQLETPEAAHLRTFARMVGQLTDRSLLDGNEVTPLCNGDEAYPQMLRAIGEAKKSVTLASYIFDNDRAGKMFADALGAAVKRGVEVRVLIDDVGARYSFPSIEHLLRHSGVPMARFMPRSLPGRFAYANLRNHRKILVVDGKEGFTGGLNIREGHYLALKPAHPIQDLHFHIRGPAVGHLQEVFLADWAFATGESLSGDSWFAGQEKFGPVLARGITTGPDGDLDKLKLALLGAIACAETSISIVSPYFLPDETLIAALNVAALRGVQVDIVLPGKSNLWLVQWASTAQLWLVLERGCRVWLTPEPFDHAKLMVVDRLWTLLGSANWDPRSLRLNFEFNVECYDPALACRLQDWIDKKISDAHRVTMNDINARKLPIRLRDGIARLLTPYL